jgi:hypothetical protein
VQQKSVCRVYKVLFYFCIPYPPSAPKAHKHTQKSCINQFPDCRKRVVSKFTFTFIVTIIISVFVPGRSPAVQKLQQKLQRSGLVPHVLSLVQKLN